MIAGRIYTRAVILVATSLAVMSFFGGHIGDFARASGVMLLILVKKISIGEFTLKLVQLVRFLCECGAY
jgi:hypothetical protein